MCLHARMDAAAPRPTIDLAGQVALVTGASSGLGRRFAVLLAANGARVVATGRRIDRLADVAAEIETAGGTCLPLQLDVTDAAQLVEVVATAEAELGPVQILVNNAGIPDAQYATKMPLELIDQVLDTNLRAPYVLSCEVARRLIELKLPGRMVNISSVGGFHYSGGGAALYSITKAGVNRLTETLERMGDLTRAFPRRRIGQPEHLDSTLLYLVSPASEMVTGTVIKVDDGQGGR